MALAGGHEGGAVTPSGRKPTPHAVTPLIRERGPVGRQATHSSYWATRSVCEGPRATGGYVTVTSLFTVFFYFPFYFFDPLIIQECVVYFLQSYRFSSFLTIDLYFYTMWSEKINADDSQFG